MNGRRGGFSLVEVLCALVILGVGLVGLTEAMTSGLQTSKAMEEETRAALLAAGRIETLRADGYFTDGEEEGDFGQQFPRYAWRQTISASSPEGLHEVVVVVEEAASKKPLYELRTLLWKKPFTLLEETDSTSRQERRPGQRGSRR